MDSSGSSFFTLIILLFFINPCISSVHTCKPSYCSESGPEIRFPFWLKGQQKGSCGYTGFGLSCNNQSQTILTLPSSGEFLVNRIDYTAQAIYINDPELCLPERISNFNVRGSPFSGAPENKYRFFNCSSDWNRIDYTTSRPVQLFCQSNKSYTVLAANSRSSFQDNLPPSCRPMPNVSVPLPLTVARYWSPSVFSEDLELIWNKPRCTNCELQGLYCCFNSKTRMKIGCVSPPKRGLSRAAKYGIVIGVGIPALVCAVGLAFYIACKIKDWGVGRGDNTDLATTAINPPSLVTVTGLDGPTIESYPKMVVEEGGHLPKPHDGTCSICLGDYQPKETIRTIPDCNHYFHSNCIDEWLKLNGTCPVCRNSPESMTVTPCSSMSSTVSSSIA